jgi:hypothetical protein
MTSKSSRASSPPRRSADWAETARTARTTDNCWEVYFVEASERVAIVRRVRQGRVAFDSVRPPITVDQWVE